MSNGYNTVKGESEEPSEHANEVKANHMPSQAEVTCRGAPSLPMTSGARERVPGDFWLPERRLDLTHGDSE